MRDDISKLPLPKSAKAYARMTSKDLGDNWSKKVDMYMDMAADLTNQSKEGFKNKDASGKVKHAFKESAEAVVARLLEDDDLLNQMGDVANRPQEDYENACDAFYSTEERGSGMVAAIHSALETVGVIGDDGPIMVNDEESLADHISVYLSDIDMDGDVNGAIDAIRCCLAEYAPDSDQGTRWALVKLFKDVGEGIRGDREGFEAEGGGAPIEDPIDAWDNEGIPQVYGESSNDFCHGNCHAFTAAMAKRHPRGEAFGLFDKRFPDEIAHSAYRLPDTDTLVDASGQYAGRTEWDKARHNFDQAEHLEWRPLPQDRVLALITGNKQRSVRQADKAVPRLEGIDRPYRYETCCVNADGDEITDMVDSAVDVSYQEFMRNVPLSEVFRSGIGYDYYWTPAQAILGGVSYDEVARNRPLTLKKDWHVSYHKSTYQGKPCYFMVHSAIEYVFVKD